ERLSTCALFRLAQPGRKIQVGAHSRPAGLEVAGPGTTRTRAASALPDLQQTHGAHRPFGQGASDLEEMTHRPPVQSQIPCRLSKAIRRQRKIPFPLACFGSIEAAPTCPKQC